MHTRNDSRLRRLATLAVFVVGTLATVATSPASTTVTIRDATASLQVDADHPAALARIVVMAGPEVTSTSVYFNVGVVIDDVRAVNGGGADLRSAMRFIASSAMPGALPPPPGAPGAEPPEPPTPSAWQSEVQGLVDLPIQCGTGPCERAFWLIAQLADATVGPVEVRWRVRGYLQFPGNAYPSAATASVAIDPPIPVAGPLPQLVVGTVPEELRLGPRQPAAARVVEIGIGADALRDDGGPVASMSIDLRTRQGSGGDPSSRGPLVTVYPLDDLGENQDGPLPTSLPRDPDPFAGCPRGEDCTRRFLVTFEWRGDAGEDEAYDWNVTVRRLDLIRAWSATSELTASVERRFDVAAGARPHVAHFEGTSTAVDFGDPAQVQVGLSTTTTATDQLFRLLPAPAVLTYRTHVLSDGPVPSPDVTKAYVNIDLPAGLGGASHLSHSLGFTEQIFVTNPLAGCRVGAACNDLTILTSATRPSADAPLPAVRFEWSLDIALYAFEEAPLELTTINQSPG